MRNKVFSDLFALGLELNASVNIQYYYFANKVRSCLSAAKRSDFRDRISVYRSVRSASGRHKVTLWRSENGNYSRKDDRLLRLDGSAESAKNNRVKPVYGFHSVVKFFAVKLSATYRPAAYPKTEIVAGKMTGSCVWMEALSQRKNEGK